MPSSSQPSPAPQSHDPSTVLDGTSENRSNRRPVLWVLVLAPLVLLLDQLTKYWAETTLVVGDAPISLIGTLLQLRLIYNSGAALSIATGMTWLLTIVVTVVVIVILRIMRKIGSRAWAVALGLLLGGALGNLADRLFQDPGFGRGHVVDFIDYAGFFVGNVADIAIVAAALMIAILSIRGIGIDGRRQGEAVKDEAPAGEDADAAGADDTTTTADDGSTADTTSTDDDAATPTSGSGS